MSGDLDKNSVMVDGVSLTPPFETTIGSMGMGFGMALSAEYCFKMVGVSAKFGYRILNSALNFNSSQGTTWSPTDADGDVIGISLNGASMTIGALIRFGR